MTRSIKEVPLSEWTELHIVINFRGMHAPADILLRNSLNSVIQAGLFSDVGLVSKYRPTPVIG